jgi:hypothetical protein
MKPRIVQMEENAREETWVAVSLTGLVWVTENVGWEWERKGPERKESPATLQGILDLYGKEKAQEVVKTLGELCELS